MRELFSRDPSVLYLSGTNQTLCPAAVLAARERYSREYERNPTQAMASVWERLWEVQKDLALFLGASADELFLRANATAVLNTLLLGIPLPDGAEILVGELEYGAVVNICRLRVARESVSLRTLRMPANALALRRATTASLVDMVVSQFGPRTKLLVLSHAMGGNGLALPIREIAAETRRRGILTVVDGTHALGALPVDFRELGDVDFYGVGLYKWMLGPKGTAFGWVAPRHHGLLRPTQGGWTTFESFAPMQGFGGGSRFQETFLMHGCHDFAPFLAIRDLLSFWRDVGPEAIRARRASLSTALRAAMAQAAPEWRCLEPPEGHCAPMQVYRAPERLQAHGPELAPRAWREHRLSVTSVCLRGSWCLVLSPHVYNDEAELEAAARAVGTL